MPQLATSLGYTGWLRALEKFLPILACKLSLQKQAV